MRNINCTFNKEGVGCKNKHIKRTLFGLGPRICSLYSDRNKKCKYKNTFKIDSNKIYVDEFGYIQLKK